MAETVISIAPQKVSAKYVFTSEADARRFLDNCIDHCVNMDETMHSIYESPYTERRPGALGATEAQ